MLKIPPLRSRVDNLLKALEQFSESRPQGSGRDELELVPPEQLDLRIEMRLDEIESYYFVETDRGHIEREDAIPLAMWGVRARN